MKRDYLQGFTLVELMIVIVVVGLMSTVALPLYESYALRAKTSDATTELLKIQMAIDRFESDNFRLPDSLEDIDMQDMKDPWGHAYVYEPGEPELDSIAVDTPSERQTRVFKNLRLANIGYHLFSVGPLPDDAGCDHSCRAKLGNINKEKQRLTAAI